MNNKNTDKRIKVLTEDIANKIAAGEVVQRPLSVVKELVENSIDAGSTQIIVKLQNSGLDLIEVKDNGIGMDLENVELCLVRHATSKILSEADIYKIMTLGFRGEALASIASVSKFKLITSTNGIDGYQLEKNGAKSQEISSSPANQGTIIQVANLFFNTPARFKYLSSTFYELSLIITFMHKVALANPEIKFELSNDTNKIFTTMGDNNIKNIFQQIYSTQIAEKLITVEAENDDFKIEANLVKPEISRSRKTNIHIAINDRIIKNFLIENMIIKGYGKLLHTNQYPICYLKITVDYGLVDVNIHPSKEQVRISMLDQLEKLVVATIAEALKTQEYISRPEIPVDTFQPSNYSFRDYITTKNENSEENLVISKDEDLNRDFELKTDTFIKQDLKLEEKQEKLSENFEAIKAEGQIKEQGNLFEVEKNISQNELITDAKFVGIHKRTYLIFENNEGLYFVDQHAAQERIRYELLKEKFNHKNFKMNKILVPVIFSWTTSEFLLISQKLEELENLGLKFIVFGKNEIRLVEADVWYLKMKNIEKDILTILELVIKNKKMSYQDVFDKVAIMMACKSSIKANHYLNENEAVQLLDQLNDTNDPYTCPHGRPIIVNLTNYQIEKMFKRIF